MWSDGETDEETARDFVVLLSPRDWVEWNRQTIFQVQSYFLLEILEGTARLRRSPLWPDPADYLSDAQ